MAEDDDNDFIEYLFTLGAVGVFIFKKYRDEIIRALG